MADIRKSLLGHILLQEGRLTLPQLQGCLDLQETLRKAGKPVPRFGTLLVEQGLLSEEELEAFLRRQRMVETQRSARRSARPGKKGDRPVVQETHGDIQFSEFSIHTPLGRDASCNTYLARHTESKAVVILRVQNAQGAEVGSEAHEFFASHAEIAKRIRHRHLQRVLAVGHVGEQHFYAAEYIEGVSLRKLLEAETRLPWVWAVQIGRDIAQALAYAETWQFVHGEIRPSNVLLTAEGIPHLCGYGTSALALQNLEHMDGGGREPLHCLAPEQFLQEDAIRAQTDVFSLGAVLYRAITGVPPYPGDTPEAVLARILREDPRAPSAVIPNVPPVLDSYLTRMLAVDPLERPGMADVAEELGSAMRHSREAPGEFEAYRRLVLSRIHDGEAGAGKESVSKARGTRRRARGAGTLPLGRILRDNALPLLAMGGIAFGTSYAYQSTQLVRIYRSRAREAYQEGDIPRAIRALALAAEQRPRDRGLLLERIGVAEESGDFEASEEALRGWLALHPDDRGMRGHLVEVLSWQEKHAEAEAVCAELLRDDPDNRALRLRRGELLRWMGRNNEAMREYAHLLEADATDADAARGLALAAVAERRHAVARRAFAAYLRAHPEDREMRLAQAETLVAAGAFAEAAEAYGRFTELAGAHPDAALGEAASRLWGGDPDGAVARLSSILEEDPGNIRALRLLVTAQRERGDTEAVLEAQRRIVERAPMSVPDRLALAHMLVGAGEFGEAADGFDALLRERPGNRELLREAARVRAWAGSYDEAIPRYRELLEAEPGRRELAREFALLLLWAERDDEALTHLQALTREMPDDMPLRMELIRLQLRMGQEADALEELATLRGNGDMTPEMRLSLAEMEIQAADADAALALYREWHGEYPEDHAATRRFAELLRAAGRHGEAWPLYEVLTAAFPEDRALLMEAAEVAGWAGHPREEIRLLERLNLLLEAEADADTEVDTDTGAGADGEGAE